MTLEEMAVDLELTKPIAHLFEGEDVKYWWLSIPERSPEIVSKRAAERTYNINAQTNINLVKGWKIILALFEPMLWKKLPDFIDINRRDGVFQVCFGDGVFEDKKLANALAKLLAWLMKIEG